MRYVNLSEDSYSFIYTAPANGEYSVCVWSADGESVVADVQLKSDSQLIASGNGRGTVCTARLAADKEYSINVSGSGFAVIEIARSALARCYSNALVISENEHKGKMISHSGDAHWYEFTAQSDSFIMLTCEPEGSTPKLSALLLDENGNLISEFEPIAGGACILRAKTESGHRYFVRIHSPEGSAGYYYFSSYRLNGIEFADMPVFDQQEYSLSRNHTLDLKEHLSGNVYLYTSSDSDICSVSEDGEVTGHRTGKAVITAYGFSSQVSCEVEVVNIPIESIDILGSRIQLYVGDDADVPIVVLPENASSGLLIYTLEDTSIAFVSDEGIVTALRPGRTVLHAATGDGGISDTIDVIIEEAPARYRALLIGEEKYPRAINESRPGTKEAVEQIAGMLGAMDIGGEKYSVTYRINASRSEMIQSVRETFYNNTDRDISLVYISCHGLYFAGTCCLQLSDGTILDMQTLESELRRVRGRIVLLLDCCASGGSIGVSQQPALFAEEMTAAFAGNMFPGSKYLVLCSTSLNQESYRISMGVDSGMTTAFARALCDAAGWDFNAGKRSTMPADTDGNNIVTFDELYTYIAKRVQMFIRKAESDTGKNYVQNVCANSAIDPMMVFSR